MDSSPFAPYALEPEEDDFDEPENIFSDYEPSDWSSDYSDDITPETICADIPHHKEVKYIVFASKLKQLMSWVHCPNCGGQDVKHSVSKTSGTMAVFDFVCESCDKSTPWHTQTSCGLYPAGNLVLSAAILFAGATPAKVLRVLSFMGVLSISAATYFRHQDQMLHLVVSKVWRRQQTALLAVLNAEEGRVVVGGDGRADSPGHSAKYGTYTLLELCHNKVLDVQLVQVSGSIL